MKEHAMQANAYQRFADDLRLGHAALRRNLPTLAAHAADTPDERERLLDLADVFTRFLYRHHEAEDRFLFPALAAHTAGKSVDVAFLEARSAEHHEVHRLLDAWTAEIKHSRSSDDKPISGSRRFAGELAPLLSPHLDAEEQALVPMTLAEMLPEKEMHETLEAAAKHIGLHGGADVVMLLVHSLDESERQILREQTSWVFQKILVDLVFDLKFARLASLTPFPSVTL